jgi:hypothetical protein
MEKQLKDVVGLGSRPDYPASQGGASGKAQLLVQANSLSSSNPERVIRKLVLTALDAPHWGREVLTEPGKTKSQDADVRKFPRAAQLRKAMVAWRGQLGQSITILLRISLMSQAMQNRNEGEPTRL